MTPLTLRRQRLAGPDGWLRRGGLGAPDRPRAAPVAARAGRDHRLQRLEAVLFLAREPLTTRKLSQYANLADGTEARTLIRRLNELYDESSRAFRVERVAGGYQLLSRAQLANWVRRLRHVPSETRLSAPALETLAVIAYRQPVLRADIEAIRGVNCGEILRQLMERDLVRIGGRSQELGRPFLYATTKCFLQTFGLETLEQLPRVATLVPAGRHAFTDQQGGAGRQDALTRQTASTQEETSMPALTHPGLKLERSYPVVPEDETFSPQFTATFEEEEDEGEEFEFEDDDGDEEDADFEDEEADDDEEFEDDDDDFEDDEDFDDEEDEDEDFDEEEDEEDEDPEWEEVDDEDEWEEEDEEDDDEDDDDDWDEEEEEEEEEEEGW